MIGVVTKATTLERICPPTIRPACDTIPGRAGPRTTRAPVLVTPPQWNPICTATEYITAPAAIVRFFPKCAIWFAFIIASVSIQKLCTKNAAVTRNRTSSPAPQRSEEHTSELQSLAYLVCRLLLEKKKQARLPGLTL